MKKRIDYYNLASSAMDHYLSMEKYFKEKTTISPTIYHLIKIRASQINGCAHCINMHTEEAIKMGETNQRIFLISVWDETGLFSEKERLALELTERVTLIADFGMSEDLFDRVRKHFTEKEYIDMILIINQINSWNRLSIANFNTVD